MATACSSASARCSPEVRKHKEAKIHLTQYSDHKSLGTIGRTKQKGERYEGPGWLIPFVAFIRHTRRCQQHLVEKETAKIARNESACNRSHARDKQASSVPIGSQVRCANCKALQGGARAYRKHDVKRRSRLGDGSTNTSARSPLSRPGRV